MKNRIISFMVISLALFAFTACTKVETENVASKEVVQEGLENKNTETITETKVETAQESFDPSKIETIGDFIVYKDEEKFNFQDSVSEANYVAVLDINGVYYRVVADLPKDVSEKIWNSEFEDREKGINELIAPLPIKKIENLSTRIPKQEELDKLIGKTGKELFDDNWTYYYYNLEDMAAGLNHGAFAYDVIFSYDGPQMENTDDFDFYEKFKDLKVKSVRFSGIGDATNIEEG